MHDFPIEPLIGSEELLAIIGAGPAGLTAAHVAARERSNVVVFEASDVVGGIATTVEHNGYRFDLGGHRFFTKLEPVERLWRDILGDDFLRRPRLSRIYYGGEFYAYPLEARDVWRRLGPIESLRCFASYLVSRPRARRMEPESFEDWVVSRFGRRLYDVFFRTYTEKVWGIPGSEIRSEWAAQRIKNLTLANAVKQMLGLDREHVTSLIEEFDYPRLGPGQMWEALSSRLSDAGVDVRRRSRCVRIRHEAGCVNAVSVLEDDGEHEHAVDGVVSTLALDDLVHALDPLPPPDVLRAAEALRFRALMLVALISTDPQPFPDNWIYLHDPETRAGRVQNFGAWSEDMVVPGTTCLGAEYFCFAGDETWSQSDAEAIELATAELGRIGLVDPEHVVDGAVVRVPKAYPMYDRQYAEAVAVIRQYLNGFENLQTCGRNGLHRYNNQDHSMWTAALATRNLVAGESHDVWSVNTEDTYLEEGAAESLSDDPVGRIR